MSEFITIKEAAKLSQKSESYIYRWGKKLPKNQVKSGRPFMVNRFVFLTHFKINLNQVQKVQVEVQNEVQKQVQNEEDKKELKPLTINKLEKVQKVQFEVQNEVQKQVQIEKTNIKFFKSEIEEKNKQIKRQFDTIQELQNTNHNLLLLVGAKEKQVNNLLEKVNLISTKIEQQDKEVIEILAQYSTDIEEMKQMIETQKSTSKAENSVFLLIYLGGAAALLISLIVVVLFFS